MRGRFITFEGGDGVGKTTQLLRLAERLEAAGIKVTTTREPGGTPVAEAVRNFLLSGGGKPLGPDGEAVLFAAARADHVERLIRPALAHGEWVLCDRFTDSTRAYQGAAGVKEGMLLALERVAVGPTTPDLTIILDMPAEAGLSRAAGRTTQTGRPVRLDRFERDNAAEHERRRRAFLAIAATNPDRCIVIDAARPEAEVARLIWQTVEDRLLAEKARAHGG